MKKRLLACILTVGCLLLSVCACAPAETEKPEHLGLYTAEDGTLMKDGKAFYGFGVNYYCLLNRAFTEKWDVSKSLKAMETLASYDVRAIRFNLTGYATTDWRYITEKEDLYFQALDSIVEKAEELGIGLMPCFFWAGSSIADHLGEPIGAAWRTDQTKTMKFIESFVAKVVTRYCESPAIYGWEFANEQQLSTDLPNWRDYLPALPPYSPRTERTEDDLITASDYISALNLFAEVVSENDPYHRIIGSGDAEPRTSAYNLAHGGGWEIDTQEEHEKMLDMVHESMTSLSFHKYPSFGVQSASDPEKVAEYLGYFSDWDGFMEYFVNQGKRMKKSVYLGETGFVYSDATAASGLTVEKISSVIQTIADAAVKADMPLTFFWNYDDRPEYDPNDPTDHSTGTEWSWNERWDKGKAILEIIRESNRAFDEKHSEE